MPSLRNIDQSLKTNENTGFSSKNEYVGGRFINKDGTFNIVKQGAPVWERWSIYNWLLSMSTWKFTLTLVVFYVVLNIFFTILYLLFGMNGLEGFVAKTPLNRLLEVYFFSAETFTTVGYGRVNPIGNAANFIATMEAMTGFCSFAVATGVMYGRFSRARAHIVFSENALIAPYKDIQGLMFRMASFKNKHALTDVTVRVTVSLKVLENGKESYKFYELDLERKRIDNLMMNWTVVHPLDERSPIYNMNWEEMKQADLEIYVSIHGFDDIYANYVIKRTSYIPDEIVPNAKFVAMFHESPDGKTTILDLDKLNEYKVLRHD
ncbi:MULTISPECIES: ion channel [Chitinophagaceae]